MKLKIRKQITKHESMQIPYPCNNEIDDIVESVINQAKRCIKCNRILKPDLLLGFFDVCVIIKNVK